MSIQRLSQEMSQGSNFFRIIVHETVRRLEEVGVQRKGETEIHKMPTACLFFSFLLAVKQVSAAENFDEEVKSLVTAWR